MKYKSKIYAKALVDSLTTLKPANDKKIVVNFIKLLQKNQDTKKTKEILALTEKLLLKKTGNKKVVLEVARKIDTKNIIKSFTKKGDSIQEKINPALVAGVKIMIDGDKQLDLSLQRKLENIF